MAEPYRRDLLQGDCSHCCNWETGAGAPQPTHRGLEKVVLRGSQAGKTGSVHLLLVAMLDPCNREMASERTALALDALDLKSTAVAL